MGPTCTASKMNISQKRFLRRSTTFGSKPHLALSRSASKRRKTSLCERRGVSQSKDHLRRPSWSKKGRSGSTNQSYRRLSVGKRDSDLQLEPTCMQGKQATMHSQSNALRCTDYDMRPSMRPLAPSQIPGSPKWSAMTAPHVLSGSTSPPQHCKAAV